jgi:hypothetical protein
MVAQRGVDAPMLGVEQVAVHGVEARAEQVGVPAPVDVVAEEEHEIRPRAERIDAPGHRDLRMPAPFRGAPLAVPGVAEEHERDLARAAGLLAGIDDLAGWRRLGGGLRWRHQDGADDGEDDLSRAHHILTVRPSESRRRPAARTVVSRSTTTWLMSRSKRNAFS